jgi:Ala-tRNA(Pro) deacylase
MSATSAIHEFLHRAHVPYSVLPHRRAFTANTEAAAAHIPGREWAKVVACFVDGEPIEAVLPAPYIIDMPRLLQLAGGNTIRLAQEGELSRLYPTCELGAMAPLGPLYGQLVFVDLALASQSEIVFNAGTHMDAITMRWSDFARAVRPIVGRFAITPG